jgi:triphosphatase
MFRPAIADEEFERIRDEFRWFMGQLGDARNLDVFLKGDLPRNERRLLSRRREEAYDAVILAMDSQRLRHAMIDLVAWAALGEWATGSRAARPLTPFVNRRIDKIWARIRDAGRPRVLSETERHHLRIDIKKLRYALEFVEALHTHRPKRRKKFMHAVEDLQECLGHINDIAVARTLTPIEPWMIAAWDDRQERQYLKDADRALRKLRKAGRYWRAKA